MHNIFPLGARPRQSYSDSRALPCLNFNINNRVSHILAVGFTILILIVVTTHAQTPDLAGGAPRTVSRALPAGYTGATPLEVMTGQATLVGRLAPTQKLRVVLGLQPPHMAEEENFLVQLQTKGSPNFRKFLTPAQWNARFAPSAEDEQRVVDWAQNQGLTVTQRYANRLLVDVEGTSETIEKAFAIQMNQYKAGDSTEFSNDSDPVIPSELQGILHSVGGLNSLQRAHALHEGNIQQTAPIYSPLAESPVSPNMHADGNHAAYEAAMKAAAERAGTDNSSMKGLAKSGGTVTPGITNGYIDPTDLYSSYGYDFNALQAQGHCCNPLGNSGSSPPEASIGIATAGDFANSDIAGFHAQYPYLAYSYNSVYVDGTPACCNDETTLDTEWSLATANDFGGYQNTAHIWIYEGANTLLSTFSDVYNQMLSDAHVRVFTTSWGCAEITCASTGQMDTDHAIFNSMVGQGWTLMAASDDKGVTAGCDDALRVQHPSSDPDMVAVGGTELALYGDGTFDFEHAWAGSHAAGACADNNGGSGGGCSAYYTAPGFQTGTIASSFCGSGARSVPDISLNAYYGENYYFNGSLGGAGGTSIAAPEVAGFMAQENAYLLAIGSGCGSGHLSSCAPMGDPNYAIYYEAYNVDYNNSSPYATHSPFYDINDGGCNSNDITDEYSLNYYCAVNGYDRVTGWGSFNALQLSWLISSWDAGTGVNPTVTFTGPPVNTSSDTWYNTDQTISWTVTAQPNSVSHVPATGVAGYSWLWDADFSDPTSEAHQGTGNLFYSGPAVKNLSMSDTMSSSVLLSSAGQGCHYLNVYGFDNTGFTTGSSYYYWICYDNVPPTIGISTNPVTSYSTWVNHSVVVTLTPADSGSGIYKTYYGVNTFSCYPGNVAGCQVYTAPFTISTPGQSYIYYWTQDKAGNVSGEPFQWVSIEAPAALTAPTPSTTLAGPKATFTWSAGVHASAYALRLGTTPGGTDVYVTGVTTATSATPTNLPLNGETIHARLYTYFGSTQVYTDYTFTAAKQSALTAPTPSTTLTGPKVTFTWSAGSEATDYALRLGTTPGGTDVYVTGVTAATSATPTNLPLNGETIHARLYTYFGSSVVYTDYTFTAAKQAALTSPIPSTTLTGSKVTFTWTAGTEATGYALRLGTTPGGNDIYGSGVTTATSATPTNLPTNGETIHARLYTYFGSSMVYTDYVYTAQ